MPGRSGFEPRPPQTLKLGVIKINPKRHLTFKEIEEYARKFILSKDISEKQGIIRKIVSIDGEDGLSVLARLVKPFLPLNERYGIKATARYLAWYGGLEQWRKKRNRKRRGRKYILPSQTKECQLEIQKLINKELDARRPQPLINPQIKVHGSFESAFR